MGNRNLGVGGKDVAFASGGPANAAQLMLDSNFFVEKAFRAHSPLTRDQQLLIDTAVNGEWKSGLQIVRRLIQNGQVMRLPRPFAYSAVSHWQDSDTTGATMARNPRVRTEQDVPDRVEVQTPIYYTFADFSLSMAELETSRNSGLPLDTNLIGQKARDIAEVIEEAVIRGLVGTGNTPLPKVGANTAYGFLNHPNIASVQYESSHPWDNASKTIPNILTDMKAMFTQLDLDNAFGPVDLWIPRAWANSIQFLTNTATDKTAFAFLQELVRGGENIFIGVADRLPANTALMYVRSKQAGDLIVGDFGGPHANEDPNAPDTNPVPITTIPWQSGDGLEFHWKLISCVVPRPKASFSGKSGIVKLAA